MSLAPDEVRVRLAEADRQLAAMRTDPAASAWWAWINRKPAPDPAKYDLPREAVKASSAP